MNIGTIAIIGSIIAGLLSLPAAAPPITGDITAAGAEITGMAEDDFSDVPRTVSEVVDEESMRKEVETAFGTVTFHSTSGALSSELETPQSHLEVERRPGEEDIHYTRRDVEIEITETPGKVEDTCTTPEGTRESVTEEGERSTEFSGVNREKVREKCLESREHLEKDLERLRSVSVNLGLTLPEVELASINASKEEAVIRNSGSTTVDLDGWTLSDSSSNSFSGFTNVTLEPGGTVTVYSGDAGDSSTCGESGGPDYELCWNSAAVWNNGGETGTLENSRGEVVDTKTY